ncbi:unnamed protein product [Caenorhabditis bovis]|uniref:N-acetyltransferase domain-containing protein n=1 Tax=Caenorhabditis bovis TaxID=2654633 RepID=A0A8S1EH73_9PELO|nr:unnamed protein product [Caenorhabditis bovis]
MGIDFDVFQNPEPTSALWKTWKCLVDTEGWTSDDNSVTQLTPSLKSTRSVFAVTKQDESFIGAVIWNEYDNISFIGFFIMAPNYRGKGVGLKIWNQAVSLMPKSSVIVLRAVPNMVDKYRASTTPVFGPKLINYRWSVADFYKAIQSKGVDGYKPRFTTNGCKIDLDQENFDKFVTGRQRKDFLRVYRELPFTQGMYLYDSGNRIAAHVEVVRTSNEDANLYKIAPLYARNEEIAFTALREFSKMLLEKYPTADLLFHVLDTQNGQQIAKFFEEHGLEPHLRFFLFI